LPIGATGTDLTPTTRNRPAHIFEALAYDFDVEVDVRWHEKRLWLGHDAPLDLVPSTLFQSDRVWFHAKDAESLQPLRERGVNYFWHDKDPYVLTSKGWVWTYPGNPGVPHGVYVMPEWVFADFAHLDHDMIGPLMLSTLGDSEAVCSDWASLLREKLQ
jgi:hypothetical protein